MVNIILTEARKAWKNKITWIGICVIAGVPLLLILKSCFIDTDLGSYEQWIGNALILLQPALSFMSGFVVIHSIQKEYIDGTMRNILTVPVGRTLLLAAKLVVWFLWYTVALVIAIAVVTTGYFMLFVHSTSVGELLFAVRLLLQVGFLGFLAGLPVFWAAVKQRTQFYPAMLLVLLFTVLEMAGWQVSQDLIVPASIVPWTAVALSNMTELGSGYFYLCIGSVFLCGIGSVIFAVRSFSKEDQ